MSRHRRRLFEPGAYPAFLDDPDAPQAACRRVENADGKFFPTGPGAKKRTEQAKDVCEGCPLREPCQEWALSRPPRELFGVWGGTSRGDRLHMAGKKRK